MFARLETPIFVSGTDCLLGGLEIGGLFTDTVEGSNFGNPFKVEGFSDLSLAITIRMPLNSRPPADAGTRPGSLETPHGRACFGD